MQKSDLHKTQELLLNQVSVTLVLSLDIYIACTILLTNLNPRYRQLEKWYCMYIWEGLGVVPLVVG